LSINKNEYYNFTAETMNLKYQGLLRILQLICIIFIIDKLTISMADRGKFLGIGGMNLKKLTNETGI
jgi:hypothetical protein